MIFGLHAWQTYSSQHSLDYSRGGRCLSRTSRLMIGRIHRSFGVVKIHSTANLHLVRPLPYCGWRRLLFARLVQCRLLLAMLVRLVVCYNLARVA